MKVFPYFKIEIFDQQVEDDIEKHITSLTNNGDIPLVYMRQKKQTPWKVFCVAQTHWFFHNSFLPDVYIRLLPKSYANMVEIRFVLKRSTQIVLLVYSCLCLVMELALMYSVILGSIAMTFIVLFPALFLLFACLLSIISLGICSRHLLQKSALRTTGKTINQMKLHYVWTS